MKLTGFALRWPCDLQQMSRLQTICIKMVKANGAMGITVQKKMVEKIVCYVQG